jgi:release factor glutamine methyltransferase
MSADSVSLSTVQDCLKCDKLLSSVSDSARLDIELLLCKALDCSRTYLYGWPEHELTQEQQQAFRLLLGERQSGRPVAHLLGNREFWSLPLKVNDSTLIPRPDTEILIETALALNLAADTKLLDLGTGTGAIALALASEYSGWDILAVDLAEAAVELARDNVKSLGFTNVKVQQSNWFTVIEPQRFNIIVSNPPYIDSSDPHLKQGDVRFEPSSALIAKDRGFADLFSIIDISRHFLAVDGWLLLEHGFEQGVEVRKKLYECGYHCVETRLDYSGNERVTLGQYSGAGL